MAMRQQPWCAVLALLMLATFLAVRPSAATAQELETPRPRQGYYIALGTYGALTQVWEKGDAVGTAGGMAATLRLGQMLTNHLGLGLQLSFAGTASDNRQASLVGLGIEGQWELLPNLALLGGVELGVLSNVQEDGEQDETDGSFGAKYFVGLSYDWFPGRPDRSGGWSLGPAAQVHILPGELATGLGVFVGLQLSYWTGLPRNQLALPESEAYQR